MLYLIPGDPVKMMLSEFQTSPEQIARMRAQLHLNDPFFVQYGRFVWNGLHGNLGTSIRDNRPVTQEIFEVFPQTVQLAVAALVLASALGLALGILAALRQNSWLDIGSMMVATLGISMPSFWLALILILIFSLHFELLPAAGGGALPHLIMPAVALGLGAAAIIARLTRSSMLERVSRAIMAAAPRPRATAGMIRWGRSPPPAAGSSSKWSEKMRIRMSASQNDGMEMPSVATIIDPMSNQEFWRSAARIPSARPSADASTSAATASCTVCGKTSKISCVTGRLSRMEVPRLPCRPFQTNRPYCTKNGSLRWSCARMRAICSGLV